MKFRHMALTERHLTVFAVSITTALSMFCLSGCHSTPNNSDSRYQYKSSNLVETDPEAKTKSTELTLNFTAIAPDVNGSYQPVDCQESYVLGTPPAKTKIADLRFYVTNLHVLTKQNQRLPLVLNPSDFQQHDVALIDLEEGMGACRERGDSLVNRQVVGSVIGHYDPSDFKGISFDIGVPFGKNHTLANSPETRAPLDIQGMSWSWQAGRKFAKIELMPEDKVTMPDGTKAGIYNLHLGRTACEGSPERGDQVNCKYNNQAHVMLTMPDNVSGSLLDTTIVLNLHPLYKNSNITLDKGKKSGCMSFKGDADCETLFKSFGLNHVTGKVDGKQQIFSLIDNNSPMLEK